MASPTPPKRGHLSLEEMMARLESHYQLVNKLVLSKQNPHTGLLPASTENNSHGNYTDAWVRDNVYSVLCVWSLALCYRRLPSGDRAYQLEAACVKCMRGLLHAMMRQAHKVERFKHTQHPLDALHAKYDTHTGNSVVRDDGWGHLQVDATSLFVYYIAQMTGSGLRIVYTSEEVAFLQNLVYYIEVAYRAPDFGLWERGNKINKGEPELNSSSIGMAKAALEAIHNLDLFHSKNQHAGSRVFASLDEIAKNRQHLARTLPRESNSKETDAALLSVVGFPAFAVSDPQLVKRVEDEIKNKLEGRYGCKRFLRDGHQCVHEDPSRLHYEAWELRQFERVECEWPLFFCYSYVTALFRDDWRTAEEYRSKLLASCTVQRDGHTLIPEVFYVKHEDLDRERRMPGSCTRLPNHNIPLIWAQSLFLVGEMLWDGVIEAADLDPLDRRLMHRVTALPRTLECPSPAPPVAAARRPKPSVRVLFVAESATVRDKLQCAVGSDFPVYLPSEAAKRNLFLRPASHLARVFQGFGESRALGLTGRPHRRMEALATSRLYKFPDSSSSVGISVLFVPSVLDASDFYFAHDEESTVKAVRDSLNHISDNWREGFGSDAPADHTHAKEAPPIFLMYVTRRLLSYGSLTDFVRGVWTKQRGVSAVSEKPQQPATSTTLQPAVVQSGPGLSATRLQVPVEISTIEDVLATRAFVALGYVRGEFLFPEGPINDEEGEPLYFLPSRQGEHLRSCASGMVRVASGTMLDGLGAVSDLADQIGALEVTALKDGLDSTNTGVQTAQGRAPAVRTLIEQCLERAVQQNDWAVVRRCAAALKMQSGAVSEWVSALLVEGVRLTVGSQQDSEASWDRLTSDLTHSDWVNARLLEACRGDRLEHVVTQELLAHLAQLARSSDLLQGVTRLRVGLLLRLLVKESELGVAELAGTLKGMSGMQRAASLSKLDVGLLRTSQLAALPPAKLRSALKTLLARDPSLSYISELGKEEAQAVPRAEPEHRLIRELHGVLGRVPAGFWPRVWRLVSDGNVTLQIGEHHKLCQEAVLEMTEHEPQFAITVHQWLSVIGKPEFRQLCVEALALLAAPYAKDGLQSCLSPAAALKQQGPPRVVRVDAIVCKAKEEFCRRLQAEDPEFYEFASEKEGWELFYAAHPADFAHICRGAGLV